MSTEPFFYSLSVGHKTCLFPFLLHLKKRWHYNNFFLSWYAVKDKPHRTTVETAPHKCLKIIFVLNCIPHLVYLLGILGQVLSSWTQYYPVVQTTHTGSWSVATLEGKVFWALEAGQYLCYTLKGKLSLAVGSQEIPTVLFPRGKVSPRECSSCASLWGEPLQLSSALPREFPYRNVAIFSCSS